MVELIEMPAAERKAAFEAWRRLPRSARIEVLNLARRQRRHPDPAVAGAAIEWARTQHWRVWWRKLPPYVLPLVGVAETLGCWFIAPDGVAKIAIVAAGVVVVLSGLLGWNARKLAGLILSLPPNPVPE
ncbi:hypothetical protein ABIA33_002973 [Streptacidiphilus sp. MAP12-16]|uniref:hypothetical protein n=1 Tax=Streptacidiphilus sp. MAP12-16 TaxID=3156300 RepID=UPI0035136683